VPPGAPKCRSGSAKCRSGSAECGSGNAEPPRRERRAPHRVRRMLSARTGRRRPDRAAARKPHHKCVVRRPTVSAPISGSTSAGLKRWHRIAPGAAAPGPRALDEFKGRATGNPGRVAARSLPSRADHHPRSGRPGVHPFTTRWIDSSMARATSRPSSRQRHNAPPIVVRPDGNANHYRERSRRSVAAAEFAGMSGAARSSLSTTAIAARAELAASYCTRSAPPPVSGFRTIRYIVEAEGAPPELIYDTMIAPPVERIERRYSLDEIRYSGRGAPAIAEHRHRQHHLSKHGSWENSTRSGGEAAGPLPTASIARLPPIPRQVIPDRRSTDAVGSMSTICPLSDRRGRIRRRTADPAIQVPAEKPDFARLR